MATLGAGRHLDRRGHDQAGRGRRAAVRRRRRPAARRGREQAHRSCSAAGSTGRATRCLRRSRRPSTRRSRSGAGTARSGVCGRATPPSGPARTSRTGSAGSTVVGEQRARLDQLRAFAEEVRARAFATCCCSAWAAPASVPKCSRRPSAARPASRAPGARFDRPGADRSIREPDRPRRARCSSCRASPAARSSRTSSSSTSSSGCVRRWARSRPGGISSRSPIPAPRCRQVAERDQFRHVFFGEPSIGGRYSVLSDFGMVPAAAMGLDARDGSWRRPPRWSRSCCAERAAGGEPGRRARRHHGHARAQRPRQGDHRRLARDCRCSAPGSSSCSRSRPASRARA